MVELINNGAYLVSGNTLVEDGANAAAQLKALGKENTDRDTARRGTMAYGILSAHNTNSGDSFSKNSSSKDSFPNHKALIPYFSAFSLIYPVRHSAYCRSES